MAEAGEVQLKFCHRCLIRLPVSAGGVDLPRRLRETLARHGLSERTRLGPTGCLGYCPVGLVSVMVRPMAALDDTHVRLIDPERDGEDLVEHLRRAGLL